VRLDAMKIQPQQTSRLAPGMKKPSVFKVFSFKKLGLK
jgi:hypothetical protein